MEKDMFFLGLDVGSITVKLVLMDADKNIVWKDYRRHKTNVHEAVEAILA